MLKLHDNGSKKKMLNVSRSKHDFCASIPPLRQLVSKFIVAKQQNKTVAMVAKIKSDYSCLRFWHDMSISKFQDHYVKR